MPESAPVPQDPKIFARISMLKIYATNLVEGLLSGQHRSRHKGSSVEFAEYKDYSPGDDIRHIDWKVVGRTDKYHIKQFEQATNLKCTILLDASGSMGYEPPLPGKAGGGMTKMDYARTLAAALSYLFLKQFDAVGLIAFNDEAVRNIPPRSQPAHFQDILRGLAELEPQGITRIGRVANDIIPRLPKRGMVILISDLLAREDDLHKTLRLVTARGLEVILFHVLHPDEVRLPFEGDIVFESLEDDAAVEVDPLEIQRTYRDLVQERIAGLKKNCPSLGVDYIFLETTTPLDQALSYYLLWRRNAHKS